MILSRKAVVLPAVKAPLDGVSVPRPAPGRGEVLVHVAAAGTNPLDLTIMAGEAAHARQPPPAVLGIPIRQRDPLEDVAALVEIGRT